MTRKMRAACRAAGVLLTVYALGMGGCSGGGGSRKDGEPAGVAILAASPANAPALDGAIATAAQLLSEGRAIPDVQAAVRDRLTGEARAFDVVLDPDDGTVSVVFLDGETHTIAVVDSASETDDLSAGRAAAAPRPVAGRARLATLEAAPMQQAGLGTYRMPASARMLLANSLSRFHAGSESFRVTDSTALVAKMLAARGYEGAARDELTLGTFEDLTSHGVVVIEAHGAARRLRYPAELLGGSSCGGPLSTYGMITNERITADKILQHAADIACGRVHLYDRVARSGTGRVERSQLFVVTPNYIREHDRGTFPDHALFIVNACSAYAPDGSSPLRDALFEKSARGARFLGWSGRVSAQTAIRATLNLFQLATGSNEELTGKRGFEALRKWIPPRGGTSLGLALWELDQRSYLWDPGHRTRLVLSAQDGGVDDLLLVPLPLALEETAPPRLWSYYAGAPTLTIGGAPVPIAEYGDMMVRFSLPPDVYGDIVLTDAGRTSVGRPLHRWRPRIEVHAACASEDAFPFLTFDAALTLLGRATLTMDSLWLSPPPSETAEPPLARFQGLWDLGASNIGWKAGGEGTRYASDGSWVHYEYTGSGLKTLRTVDGSGMLSSLDGATAEFVACATPTFTMTWRSSDGRGGKDNIDWERICVGATVERTWDWTVAGGSYQERSAFGTTRVSWNAFAAEPPFEEDLEPR